jgi:hypothetical protein
MVIITAGVAIPDGRFGRVTLATFDGELVTPCASTVSTM